MKNRLTNWVLILTLSILPALVFSQGWAFNQHTGDWLNKVFTLDNYHAYIVGDQGVFFRTTNGGWTWDQIQTNTNNQLFDVQFINSSVGYICGANGTFLKTTDGGDTWHPSSTHTALHLKCVCFLNPNVGWVTGSSNNTPYSQYSESGIILKTTDGGNSFSLRDSIGAGIERIAAYNMDTLLASENSSNPQILRSVNSGVSWQTVHTCWVANTIVSINAFSSGLAYVGADGVYLLKTTDFGATWDSSTFVLEPLGATFPSPLIGYAATFNPMAWVGWLSNSTDGGQTWSVQLQNDSYSSVNFCNDTVGFAVSFSGEIYKHGILTDIAPHTDLKSQCVNIYPDPVTSFINIAIQDDSYSGSPYEQNVVEIFSAKGDKISEETFSGTKYSKKYLESLSPGLYYLVIENHSTIIYSKQFIKK